MTDKINLSVYLVTDSTPELLRGRDICAVVEEALQGGEATQLNQLSSTFNVLLLLIFLSSRRHDCPVS